MELKTQIGYQSNKIVAQDLIKNDNGRATILAFDANTELTAHKAPGDAMVQVIEGSIDFVVGGKRHHLQAGEFVTMSVGTVHEVYAPEQAKVLLTIVKNCCCDSSYKSADKPEGLLPD